MGFAVGCSLAFHSHAQEHAKALWDNVCTSVWKFVKFRIFADSLAFISWIVKRNPLLRPTENLLEQIEICERNYFSALLWYDPPALHHNFKLSRLWQKPFLQPTAAEPTTVLVGQLKQSKALDASHIHIPVDTNHGTKQETPHTRISSATIYYLLNSTIRCSSFRNNFDTLFKCFRVDGC